MSLKLSADTLVQRDMYFFETNLLLKTFNISVRNIFVHDMVHGNSSNMRFTYIPV